MDFENIRLIKRVEALEAEIIALKARFEAANQVLTTPIQAAGETTQPVKRGPGRPRKS